MAEKCILLRLEIISGCRALLLIFMVIQISEPGTVLCHLRQDGLSTKGTNPERKLLSSPWRHFLYASLPARLAAAHRTRYNFGSHIEVNQP